MITNSGSQENVNFISQQRHFSKTPSKPKPDNSAGGTSKSLKHNLSKENKQILSFSDSIFEDSSSNCSTLSEHPPQIKHKLLMFCNIYRVFVACGVLVMPHAMSLSGFIPSMLIVIFVSGLTTLNHNYMNDLCRFLSIAPGVTLETLSGRIYGNKMKQFILLIISGSQLCAFIGSFVLATDLLHHTFCNSLSSECISRSSIALLLAAFNLGMVFIPNLKTFGYISSLSVVFQFCALFCVCFSACKMLLFTDDALALIVRETLYTDWANSIKTLGIVLYIFQRMTFYLPIKSNYAQIDDFHRFYLRSMNSVFFYIFLISSPCYFLFFKSGREIVFQNFDNSFRMIQAFKLCYVFVIFLSNPINLFPIYNSIYSVNWFNKRLASRSRFSRFVWKLMVRFVVSCVGIAIGVWVNSFVNFCSFVGAFFFSFLGLILPGLLLLKFLSSESSPSQETLVPCTIARSYLQDKNSIVRRMSLVAVIGTGVAIFAIATWNSVRELMLNPAESI